MMSIEWRQTFASGGGARWPQLRRTVALVVALSFSTAPAGAEDALADALIGGETALELRYRFEHVDQDGFERNANASTARLRLNYRSADVYGLSAFAEFDYVAELLADDFNSGGGTSPTRTAYPVVADPQGTDLNQLYLDFQRGKDFRVRAGRQRILLDNQRFVGGVGWRQNEQTYDGLSVDYRPDNRYYLQLAHLVRVDRIFGDRSADGRHDVSVQLLNLAIKFNQHWSVSPYAYLIDNDDVPAFSTTTLGARVHGNMTVSGKQVSLTADLATQEDMADAPVDYRADYLRLDVGLAVSDSLKLGAGLERLGGDSAVTGKAFRTPLATLHAFQGWADQFLVTPDAGIDDRFLTVRYELGSWSIDAVGHTFTAESGSRHWGREIDLSVGRSFRQRYNILFKLASFNATDTDMRDAVKLWLQIGASF